MESNGDQELLLDSGASCHIITNDKYFVTYDTAFKCRDIFIQTADGKSNPNLVTAKGIAHIPVTDSDNNNCIMVLKNALYVPSFRRNIVSVQLAIRQGYKFHLNELGGEKMICPKGNIFTIRTSGNLYYLNNVEANTVAIRSLLEWHRILGHSNCEDIKHLSPVVKNMKIKGSTKNIADCEICIKSKMTKSISKIEDIRGYKPFSQVHCDLNGPILEDNESEYKYIFGAICDYSQFLTVFLLTAKSEASNALKQFLADVAPYGPVKTLRSDNGGNLLVINSRMFWFIKA